MDWNLVARQLVRALRGKASQRAMSMRLGYSTNVFYAWESGRRAPSATELLRLAAKRGIDVTASLSGFAQAGASEIVHSTGADQVTSFLRALQGKHSVKDLAARADASRYQVMRWLGGHSEPKAADLLRMVEATTMRGLDFVAMLAEPTELPAAKDAWNELEARRRIALELPWSQAMLRAMELEAYRESSTHRPGWVAHTVGISMSEEAQCIEALERAGLIRWNGRRYDLTEATVDTSFAPEKAREDVKRHWLDVAREQVGKNSEGLYSYNLVSLSRSDLVRLRALHIEYFQTVRSIVAESAPECVALIAMQLFELGAGERRITEDAHRWSREVS